ncbi:hypothetical protein Q0590_36650 [Rhodocytophaga aerolata]|uniref:Outer membrane protein beta-barrel domain-containing protein n=1 Tax=Rhodocytophaga aerolata TaxID=455078 RepID=A0ABT8RLB4_9BACT|nr:hypothetical protein [Rhodocytophaga aerolata]MDO1451857.1 hypothetical protein [Rhodocytophaga aerolata]
MKTLFTLLTILIIFPVLAQENFQPGWVVTQASQDTIKGYVDYREWEINPKQIYFKPADSEQKVTYTLLNCSAFGVEKGEFYKKAIITKYVQPIVSTQITIDTREESQEDSVFLRCLVDGSLADLYELAENGKKQYFMETPQAGMQALRYYKTKNAQTGAIASLEIYKGQLQALVKENKKLTNELKVLAYTDTQLYKFFIKMNQLTPQKATITKTKLVFWLGGGVSSIRPKFSGDLPNWDSRHKFDRSYGPLFSIGGDVESNRLQGRIFMRLGASYYANEYESLNNHESNNGGEFERSYQLSHRNYMVNFSLNGGILPLSAQSFIYIGAGVRYNLSTYPKNSISLTKLSTGVVTTRPGPEAEKRWGQFFGQAGMRINRHLDASISYTFAGSFMNYNRFGVSIPAYQFGFIYRL